MEIRLERWEKQFPELLPTSEHPETGFSLLEVSLLHFALSSLLPDPAKKEKD